MTETPGRYDSQAEGDRLYQECLDLLNRIRRKRLNVKLLKASRYFLELTLNYKTAKK
jgi:hypothetical protein